MNKNAALKTGATEVNLEHYKSILKDQSAVQAAEKVLREFKAVDYDVSKWDQAVDSFQGKAVQAAKETVAKIETEEKSLKETLSNISEARPFEDLTVSHSCAMMAVGADMEAAGWRGEDDRRVVDLKGGDGVSRDGGWAITNSDDSGGRRLNMLEGRRIGVVGWRVGSQH
jgi:hypothetical protein